MLDDKPPEHLTYAAAGVDLDQRQEIIERYRDVAAVARHPQVLGGIGPFAGLFALGRDYSDPVIVATTDTVGTKGRLAAVAGRFEDLGRDIVNHCANDAFTTGATPLFFMDTIVSAGLPPDAKVAIVKGVAQACSGLGVALLGGETADMPGTYLPTGFDLIGFLVAAIERDQIIDGRNIRAGDLLFGLPSNGLHTNGYSLARRALGIGLEDSDPSIDKARLAEYQDELHETLADALLRPHFCYVDHLRPALGLIKGMAHITGGSFQENVPRMLPAGFGASVDRSAWTVPPVFRFIQRRGAIDEEEMYRVFNMGIGMVLAVSPDAARRLQSLVPGALQVGEVVQAAGPAKRFAWT